MRTPVGARAVDGKLYAIGGEFETKFAHEGTLYLSSVEIFTILYKITGHTYLRWDIPDHLL